MAARGGTTRFPCADGACTEIGRFEYRTRAEYDSLHRRYSGVWKCLRHSKPDEVLSEENPLRETVLVATPREGRSADGLFWHDVDRLGSGFQYGPGFKAYAADFPPGTRLVITARIVPATAPN